MINKSVFLMQFDNFTRKIILKYYKLILFTVFSIAVAVRIYKFGIIPAGFNQDGAMAAIDALAIANYGTDRFGMWLPVHFTAWGYGQMSVLLSYLMVPFIWLLDLNEYTARLPILLASLVSLFVIYLISFELLNRKFALVVLAFTAINPWHIMQSRWALDCNLLPHFFLFSVYFLILAIKRNKNFGFLSMLFFGLTMYTYGIAWYSVPLFLLFASVYFIRHKIFSLLQIIKYSICYLFVSWPIFAVMIVNTFRLQTIETPFFTIPFFPHSQRTNDMLFFAENKFSQLFQNIKSIFNTVILQKPDLPWNSIPEYGTIYLFSIPLLIFGFVNLFILLYKNKSNNPHSQKHILFLITSWLFISLLSGIIINGVNINRINIMFYPLIILCSLGIYFIIKIWRPLVVIFLIVYSVAFFSFSNNYFNIHSKVIAEEFYYGFGECLKYLEPLSHNRIYVTNWTQDKGSWWVSETLTLFHHKVDSEYYQNKKSLFADNSVKLPPYSERYKFIDIDTLNINPNENCVYVAREDEINFFDPDLFKMIKHGKYYAVIPYFIDDTNTLN